MKLIENVDVLAAEIKAARAASKKPSLYATIVANMPDLAELRRQGCTWPEIANALSEHGVYISSGSLKAIFSRHKGVTGTETETVTSTETETVTRQPRPLAPQVSVAVAPAPKTGVGLPFQSPPQAAPAAIPAAEPPVAGPQRPASPQQPQAQAPRPPGGRVAPSTVAAQPLRGPDGSIRRPDRL